MTLRNPQGKSSRTKTAKALLALRSDLQQTLNWVQTLAEKYQDPTFSEDALEAQSAMVDFALDKLVEQTRNPIWPRAWHYRTEYIRAPSHAVVGVTQLGPAHRVIVIARSLAAAHQDVERLTWRNPRDRRIIYVTAALGVERVYGFDRNTPYHVHSWPEVDHDRLRASLKVRFGQPMKSLAELVSLIDWRTTQL